MSEHDHDEVLDPYLPLWQVAVVIVVFSFLALIATLALVRTPAYALAVLGNPLLYLGFAVVMTIALGAFFVQNRASLP